MKLLLAGVFWPYPQLVELNKLTFFQWALNEIFFFFQGLESLHVVSLSIEMLPYVAV